MTRVRLVAMVEVRGRRTWEPRARSRDQRATVGADPSCDWCIPGNGIAPQHVELYWDGATLFIADLAGRGDVRVGANEVEDWVALEPNAVIRFGTLSIRVEAVSTGEVTLDSGDMQEISTGTPPPRRIVSTPLDDTAPAGTAAALAQRAKAQGVVVAHRPVSQNPVSQNLVAQNPTEPPTTVPPQIATIRGAASGARPSTPPPPPTNAITPTGPALPPPPFTPEGFVAPPDDASKIAARKASSSKRTMALAALLGLAIVATIVLRVTAPGPDPGPQLASATPSDAIATDSPTRLGVRPSVHLAARGATSFSVGTDVTAVEESTAALALLGGRTAEALRRYRALIRIAPNRTDFHRIVNVLERDILARCRAGRDVEELDCP